ncbi:ABC transporter ATP-binding protein [Shinella daejeonensis]|uniref:ABC transporter ATP-binding protein n=1 Tax=Shinella daejeonensis TaxID=659017 RepID=UPI0020C76AC7|nr:ABC transporter ATP-binding protein [Shinella daejeonensis]MCP8894431.1 ABC transporter ATP-binding protein [Shinella daejeonensis]
MTQPLLDVDGLKVDALFGRYAHPIIRDVSFRIMPGEAYGLVGESGSGKSVTSLGVMGLLKKPLRAAGGEIRFKGRNLLTLPKREMRRLRGNRIAMIFQEPMTALNPLSTVGRQIAEMFVLHQDKSWAEARELAVKALESVRVPNPDRRARNYPHQMSGGMRQRVMIAMALACNPDLLIADEPTTALDVTVQAEVLRLIKDLCAERGTAVLFISHDLGVIASICQRVGVMYAGCLVEENETRALFSNPRHEYTRGLLGALPRLGSRSLHGRQRLVDIDSIIADRSALTETRFIAPRDGQEERP